MAKVAASIPLRRQCITDLIDFFEFHLVHNEGIAPSFIAECNQLTEPFVHMGAGHDAGALCARTVLNADGSVRVCTKIVTAVYFLELEVLASLSQPVTTFVYYLRGLVQCINRGQVTANTVRLYTDIMRPKMIDLEVMYSDHSTVASVQGLGALYSETSRNGREV